MIRIEETNETFVGIDDLIKALKDGSLLRKLRNENSRLKREIKRLRKRQSKFFLDIRT